MNEREACGCAWEWTAMASSIRHLAAITRRSTTCAWPLRGVCRAMSSDAKVGVRSLFQLHTVCHSLHVVANLHPFMHQYAQDHCLSLSLLDTMGPYATYPLSHSHSRCTHHPIATLSPCFLPDICLRVTATGNHCRHQATQGIAGSGKDGVLVHACPHHTTHACSPSATRTLALSLLLTHTTPCDAHFTHCATESQPICIFESPTATLLRTSCSHAWRGK